ncbi:MAG TPA: Gmad2 immunoglobulin-like domain-containing protein [Oscillospiraceae bacterium]|nr:Gmad2 immunoglobulin-like domain-containing protein [Oscillospiraceae bacterium]
MKKLLTSIGIILFSLLLVVGCAKNNATPPKNDEQEPPAVVDPDDNQEGPIVIDPAEPTEEPLDENDLTPTPEDKEQVHQIVLYFPDSDLLRTYRVKTQITLKEHEQLPKAALEAWLAGPRDKKLTGLADEAVVIEYVKDVKGVAQVSFSKEVQDLNVGFEGELLFAEQVAMIMQQFGYEQTQLLLEGKVVETLFGHLYTKEPMMAKAPADYRWVEEMDTRKFVLQNTAFRIYEPAPGTVVKDRIVIRGLARVFEANFLYEFEDGHNILAKGYTTASEGAPGWGEFTIVIEIDEVANNSGTIIIYEASAKDGSRMNELRIPVTVAK